MTQEEALEHVAVGIGLLVAQNIITQNPFFAEEQIGDYLKMRRQYHATFVEAANLVADALLGTDLESAAPRLRSVAALGPRQTQRALVQAARALQGLARGNIAEIADARMGRLLFLIRSALRLVLREDTSYYSKRSTFADMFERMIRLQSTPPKIRTFFRTILKLGGGEFEFVDSPNPGAWFSMSAREKHDIEQRLRALEAQREAAFHIEDADARQDEYRRTAQEIAALQAEAGVNAHIIARGDREPLSNVLRRESKMNRDGPTEYLVTTLQKDLESSWEEYPNQRPPMLSKRELGKILTTLSKAATFDTVERIIREAVERKLLRSYALDGVLAKIEQVRKNKVIREGLPLAPLEWTPKTVAEFMADHDTGEIRFDGDFGEEQKQEILGRASRAISDLEGVFGKGFCGKHAKKLEFTFSGGSGVGGFARASYFGWEDRNRWQPRVKFGEDFQGLLAHELSHYYEDLLAYRIEDKVRGVPAYQYGDVGHGWGDLFGRTGTTVDYFLERHEKGKTNEKSIDAWIAQELPEVVELMQAVADTDDYRRWSDKIGSSLETVLSRAIEEVTGKSAYDSENEWMLNAKYKSELPPEIVEAAERAYGKLMDGDTRKLTYYQSSSEVWARMTEQYVYTKLAEAGISNPWLTQLTYDIDVMDQFMDQATFEEKLVPIFDRIFAGIKTRDIMAMARRITARYFRES